MAVTTEPPWLYKEAGTAGRNGTTSHTITPATPATPGSLLVVIIAGAVTHTGSGSWVERQQPVNSAELSLFTLASAAGGDSLTVTHNGSNYPVRYVWYEFPSGSTYTGSTGAAANSTTFPALGSLPGTEQVIIAAICNGLTNGVNSESATWPSPWVEDDDTVVPFSTTDGIWLSAAHRINYTGTTITPSFTINITNQGAPDYEKIVAAFNVAAATSSNTGTVGATLPALTASAAGTSRDAGAAIATIPALSASAAGVSRTAGAVSSSFPALTASAAGTVTDLGAFLATLPALSASGTATTRTAGALTASLPPLAASATGTVTSTGGGVLAATLPALTASLDGASKVTGSAAAALPALSASAAATVRTTGVLSVSLPALQSVAAASTEAPGSLAAALPALSAQAAASVSVSGDLAATLPALAAATTGKAGEELASFALSVGISSPSVTAVLSAPALQVALS